MVQIVKLLDQEGREHLVFLSDVETGNAARDLISVPGAYDTVISQFHSDGVLCLEKLVGTIGAYKTSLYALTVDPTSTGIQDLTQQVAQLLSVPETAAKAIMSSYSEELQASVEQALDSVHAYEAIRPTDKLCLPSSALVKIPAEQAEQMVSTRKTYFLKNTDNQEIFQSNYDAEFGILLPSLDLIHGISTEDLVSALDILRVTAPYRKQERPGAYSYKSIYHTPYYKVSGGLKGFVPSYLSWIDGYPVNNMLDIAPNERHMANNLQTLICADISRYVCEMVSGVFFATPFGTLLARLCSKRDEEVVRALLADVADANTEQVSCNISYSDFDSIMQNGWYEADCIGLIRSHLQISHDYLIQLIESRPVDRRTVDCDNLPFVLDINDATKGELSSRMISMGYLSSAMQKFLVDICRKAYRAHWGHTGATLAVPGFVSKNALPDADDEMAAYLADRAAGEMPSPQKYPDLYVMNFANPDSDEDGSSDDSDEIPTEIFTRMDYYVTDETAAKMSADSLSPDFFSTPATSAQTTEASIVEYWRNVNGENNLSSFLLSSFLMTADTSIFVEAFIKLMRWGERKPKLLVLQNHSEIRYVFDLVSGMKVENTSIVDEADLIRVNNCDYSLAGFLCTKSNSIITEDRIVGFLLQKDYGTVVKYFLASWLDMGEMFRSGEIVIGDFMSITNFAGKLRNMVPVEDFEKTEYDIYVSDSNIKRGLEMKVQPKDLSAMSLLTMPGVLNSVAYMKSLKNDVIITLKDRQYDLLRRYVAALNKLYTLHSDEMGAMETSVQLSQQASQFLEIFESGDSEKQDSNEKTAQNTMRQLNLGDASERKIDWDDTELKGKFYLISDMDMKSGMPSIEFTDAAVRDVAAKVRNRIVMLILQTPDKYILCRKDIVGGEIARVSAKDPKTGKTVQKLAHKSYAILHDTVTGLLQGAPRKINGVPAVLHRSLSGFVDI